MSKVVTAEDQIRAMRAGYSQTLELKLGKLEVPCRILSSTEQTTLIVNAKAKVRIPKDSEESRHLFEGEAVMRETLYAACTVDNVPNLIRATLDKMSNPELLRMYDLYMTLMHQVNPEFENLTEKEIGEIVDAIKKKNSKTKDYFTWQLAAIGSYFLERI